MEVGCFDKKFRELELKFRSIGVLALVERSGMEAHKRGRTEGVCEKENGWLGLDVER